MFDALERVVRSDVACTACRRTLRRDTKPDIAWRSEVDIRAGRAGGRGNTSKLVDLELAHPRRESGWRVAAWRCEAGREEDERQRRLASSLFTEKALE
jgi:hypothetical protein